VVGDRNREKSASSFKGAVALAAALDWIKREQAVVGPGRHVERGAGSATLRILPRMSRLRH
jgi:hypothetical protein